MAGEGRDQVDASPRVPTRTTQTFVHIQLALLPFKPGQTQALVPVVQVQAGGVVPTGKRLTFVNIDLRESVYLYCFIEIFQPRS